MILLTTINDIRKYRQLGKQLNQENFDGRVREVQENELTELLGRALSYDFFNSLENSWTPQAATYTITSVTNFTAESVDLTGIISDGCALRVKYTYTNPKGESVTDIIFVIVKTITFDGTDTLFEVEGYDLPTSITSLEWKAENKYIKLLNGSEYTSDSETVKFNGLRPFISWKLLAIFAVDGNVKHSDTGNFSITSPNFERPTSAEINGSKSTYLQNSTREENNIIEFLNENSTIYTLWNSKPKENIENFNFIVV